jgi:hypothetical protein
MRVARVCVGHTGLAGSTHKRAVLRHRSQTGRTADHVMDKHRCMFFLMGIERQNDGAVPHCKPNHLCAWHKLPIMERLQQTGRERAILGSWAQQHTPGGRGIQQRKVVKYTRQAAADSTNSALYDKRNCSPTLLQGYITRSGGLEGHPLFSRCNAWMCGLLMASPSTHSDYYLHAR